MVAAAILDFQIALPFLHCYINGPNIETCGTCGPLFFLIYINDIANISYILQLILFADDTNLFAFHRNLHTLDQLVNRELELLNTYFKVNKLSLNVDKTVFMVFTSARKKI